MLTGLKDLGTNSTLWVFNKTWSEVTQFPLDIGTNYGISGCETPEGFVILGGRDNRDKSMSLSFHYTTNGSYWHRLPDMKKARYNVSVVYVRNF